MTVRNVVRVADEEVTRSFLVKLKKKAIRNHVWYGLLNRVERGLLDSAMRYVEAVKAGKLACMMVPLLERLSNALQSGMARVLVAGELIAVKLSHTAESWGNQLAREWTRDKGYHRALGLGVLFGVN